MAKEIFKDIKGFEGLYKVSSLGRVYSLISNKYLKFGHTKTGYQFVALRKNNKTNQQYVHRLVAFTFLASIKNKNEINHIDGDKTNNNKENVEWVSHKENMAHAGTLKLMPRGESCSWSILSKSQVLWIRKNYIPRDKLFSGRAIAKRLGIDFKLVSSIVNRNIWKHI